jgi:hypothetical protein
MSAPSLQKLEQAIRVGNPFLAERLKPGLPKSEIRTALARAKITGAVEPLIDLYSWKNGTILDEETALEKTGFFPGEIYQFVDLETAVQNWKTMNDAAGQLSEMFQGTEAESMFEFAGQYFPVLWDGATGSLALDLEPSEQGRVMMVEFESTEPIRDAYGSFNEFIADAIRAYTEGHTLACFEAEQ